MPQGAWITKCGVTGKKGDDDYLIAQPESDVFVTRQSETWGSILLFSSWTDDFSFRVVFADLEPGTTYEARYRDTNLSECVENPPAPASWFAIAEERPTW